MSRRRVVGAVVALALVLAVLFWHRTRSATKSETTTAAQHQGSRRSDGMLAMTGEPTAQKRVAGSVFLEGAPGAGASVRLVDARDLTERTVQADATGHFDFGSVVIGKYFVLAEAPHATGASLSVDLRNPVAVPPADQLRLVMHTCEAVLHGVIRDASGGTIAKARIAESDRGIVGPSIDSADDGSYELCVSVGSSSIIVRADGYADLAADVAAFGKIRRDFDLVPEAVVGGRAVRADDGSPVANARVVLVAERRGMSRMSLFSVTSDNDGRFRFRGVGRGTYTITASAPHLVMTQSLPVTADIATPVEDIQCSLVAALSVSGHVVDKKKNPIAGASVSIQSTGPFNFATMDDYAITQTDGSFVVDHLAPGEYRLRVSRYALAKAQRELTLDKSDVANLVLEVDPLGSIAGRVTRGGKPVEGADVSARPDESSPRDFENMSNLSTRSDADGHFTLRGLPADTYHVYAQSERVGAFTEGPEVELAEAEAKTGVEVEMELAASIAGVVVDQNEAPVAGVHLRFSLLHGQDFGEATTGEDGTFKASALSGGGDYLFEIRPSSTSAIALRPAEGKRFPPITVKDGNTHVTGVRIKIRYERLSISGRVLASTGEGAPDVSVTAEQDVQSGWASPMATTDTAGRFTIHDLPDGTYSIRAQAANAAERVKNIAAGAKSVEIRLPGLGTIDGTVVGFPKPPTVTAFMPKDDDMIAGMPLRATTTGNRFTFTNVPAGLYSLMARSDEGYASGSVTVTVGAKAEVTLTNTGVGTVEGRVVDDKGAPMADLRCMAGGGRTAMSDSNGKFRIDRVMATETSVWCSSSAARGAGTVTVAAGSTTHIDIVAKTGSTFSRSYAGLQFETRLSDVVVTKVDGGSPGEKAGIKTGDVLTKIADRAVDGRWGSDNVLRMIEGRPPGTVLKLAIERDDKDQTVELKLEAPRNP